MFEKYFEDWEVKREFSKEFVSLWNGWLGVKNLHKLDEVTESEWGKFNAFISLIFEKYQMELVDWEHQKCSPLVHMELALETYAKSREKNASQFSKFVIPALDCVITEEWDYTYIIWHKNNGAVEALSPLVRKSGLHNFHD